MGQLPFKEIRAFLCNGVIRLKPNNQKTFHRLDSMLNFSPYPVHLQLLAENRLKYRLKYCLKNRLKYRLKNHLVFKVADGPGLRFL